MTIYRITFILSVLFVSGCSLNVGRLGPTANNGVNPIPSPSPLPNNAVPNWIAQATFNTNGFPSAPLFQNADGSVIVGPQLAKLKSNGSLDTSFGVGGILPFTTKGQQTIGTQSTGAYIALTQSQGIVRFSATGVIDRTFAISGPIPGWPYGLSLTPTVLAVQSDDKILVGTETGGLIRLTMNGDIDTTYGNQGSSDVPKELYEAADCAITFSPDKTLTYLLGCSLQSNFTLERFNSSGHFDTTFGTNGELQGLLTTVAGIPGGGGPLVPWLYVQPADGKLVLGGLNSSISTAGVYMVRLATTGKIDTTFGTNGTGLFPGDGTPISNSSPMIGFAMTSTGNFVQSHIEGANIVTSELSSSGSPVTAIGTNSYPMPSGVTVAGSQYGKLFVDSSDDLLYGGLYLQGTSSASVFLKVGSNNALNPLYGNSGFATINYPEASAFNYVRQGLNGTLVAESDFEVQVPVTGSVSGYGYETFGGIARFTSTGQLDSTFGNQGVVVVNLATAVLGANAYPLPVQSTSAIEVGADGKILLLGSLTSQAATTPVNFMARYNVNGTLDTTFGNQGLMFGTYLKVKPLASGSILVLESGRSKTNASINDLQIVRLTSTGQMDTTFGTNGLTEYPTIVSPFSAQLAVTPSGNVVFACLYVTATSPTATEASALGMVTSSGMPVPSFGNQGIAASAFLLLKGIGLQSNGGILLAEQSGTLARYTSTGQLDTSFGQSGYFNLPPGDTTITFAVASDDSLFIYGRVTYGTQSTFVRPGLFKLTANGTINSSFGTNGIAVYPQVIDGTYGYFGGGIQFDMTELPNGNLILGAASGVGAPSELPSLVCVQPSGSLCPASSN
jgi:uncharacterized delta-60 repeat protein